MGEVNPDVMKETEKPHVFHDSTLVKRAALRVIGGGQLPLPDEVASVPTLWEADVMRLVFQIRRQQAFIQVEKDAEREAEREAEKNKPKQPRGTRRGR